MNVKELAETMDGETVSWLRNLSAELGTTITGSAIIEEEGKFYNRMLWAYPDGNFTWYDKRHRNRQ